MPNPAIEQLVDPKMPLTPREEAQLAIKHATILQGLGLPGFLGPLLADALWESLQSIYESRGVTLEARQEHSGLVVEAIHELAPDAGN